MRKTKKILTITSLVAMSLCVLLLIGAIFGLKVFDGTVLKILLTFATIAVGSAFAISAVNIFDRNRIISIVALSLIALSMVFGLIVFWMGFNVSVAFNKFTLILSMLAILFNIIVSLILKLDKRYLVLQIITYAFIVLIDIILTLQILNVDVFGIKSFWKYFIAICLIAFGLLCATSIIGRRSDVVQKDDKTNGFVKVPKTEYEEMKKRIESLEEENRILREKTSTK